MTFRVITPVLNDRLVRLYLQFQHFESEYVPQKVVKGKALADHPIPDDWKLTVELSNEDAKVVEIQSPWKMYFDEASHHERAGAGVIFVTSQKVRRDGFLRTVLGVVCNVLKA
ncbi:hypothetical protein KY285_024952 [Solanum tuberosum]|nr:hypothetical protein KY285_024952 [Solanum tuberosum]